MKKTVWEGLLQECVRSGMMKEHRPTRGREGRERKQMVGNEKGSVDEWLGKQRQGKSRNAGRGEERGKKRETEGNEEGSMDERLKEEQQGCE